MNLNNSSDRFNELVFEDRNKDYGAYAMRSSYSQNVSRSLIISTGSFLLLFLLAAYITNRKIEVPVFEDGNLLGGVVIDIKPPVVDPPKPPIAPPKTPSAPKTYSGAFIASNDSSTLDKSNLDMKISKNPNPKGPEVADSIPKDPIIPFDPPPLPPPIVKIPDKMPELKDLYERITRALKYPSIAVDNQTSGTVYVSFIVNTDGNISDVEVLKGVGDGCSEEAVRVTKLLTGWTPGYKDGKAVRVPCTLPIKFRLK